MPTAERDYPQDSPIAQDYKPGTGRTPESPIKRDYPLGHAKNAESPENLSETAWREADEGRLHPQPAKQEEPAADAGENKQAGTESSDGENEQPVLRDVHQPDSHPAQGDSAATGGERNTGEGQD